MFMKGFHTGYSLVASILAIIAAESCSYTLNVSGDGEEDALCIIGFPEAGADTSFVEVSVARPLGSERRVLSPGTLDFRVTVNGEECITGLYSSGRQSDTYYIDKVLAEGDQVEMIAESARFGTVNAVATVPDAPRFRVDQPASQVIFPPSNDGIKRYYGMRVFSKMMREEVDWGRTGSRQYSVFEDIDTVLAEGSSPVTLPDMEMHNIKTIVDVNIDGRSMLIFEDWGNASDSLVITTNLILPENQIIYNNYTRDTIAISWFCRVEAYSLSELAYKYLNPQVNRSLLGFGLIPPFLGSGNVEGGFGIFSCLGSTDSGWIPQTVIRQ